MIKKEQYDAPMTEVLEMKLETGILIVSGRDPYDQDPSNPFA